MDGRAQERMRRVRSRSGVKIAALDVGRARIGIAVSDPDTDMALPHSVLERRGTRRDVAALRALFDRLGVVVVVVGAPPEQDDGEAGSSGLARRFAQAVAADPGRNVFLVDEADTTVEAHAELRALGLRAARRRLEVDRVAAARILDRYLAGEHAFVVPARADAP